MPLSAAAAVTSATAGRGAARMAMWSASRSLARAAPASPRAASAHTGAAARATPALPPAGALPPATAAVVTGARGLKSEKASQGGAAESAAPPLRPDKFHVDPEIALKQKTTGEIARAVSLLYACSFPALVRNADTMIDWSRRVLGAGITDYLLKNTFAAQYTGGETIDDLRPTIARLNEIGVGAILDYAAEEDLPDEQEELIAPEPGTKVAPAPEAEPTLVDDLQQPHVVNEAMLDRREGALAKTYFFEDDATCRANMEVTKTAITHAAEQADNGIVPIAAVKLTSLLRPAALLSVSRVLHLLQHTFPPEAIPIFPLSEIPGAKPGDPPPELPTVSVSGLVDALRGEFPALREGSNLMDRIAHAADLDGDQRVDYVNWYHACEILWQDREVTKAFGWDPIPQADMDQVALGTELASELAEVARSKGVRMMVDAEQTYFQNAIDAITMRLQERFNADLPIVYNTIQCYLRDARPRLHLQMQTHKRVGVKSGYKLVRGAYIVQERQRAELMKYDDPTCESITATHENYDACVRDMLDEIKNGAEVMIATHNQASIENAVNYMVQRGQKIDDGVCFGQLLGMGDHLTAAVAAYGCRGYKYVPYGPTEKVVAYLTRRVQENSTMLAGEPVIKERRMLRRELVRRTFGLGG